MAQRAEKAPEVAALDSLTTCVRGEVLPFLRSLRKREHPGLSDLIQRVEVYSVEALDVSPTWPDAMRKAFGLEPRATTEPEENNGDR